jgi:hypothetical protein
LEFVDPSQLNATESHGRLFTEDLLAARVFLWDAMLASEAAKLKKLYQTLSYFVNR